MNILKNMEAIFVAALVLASASTYAQAAITRGGDAGKAQPEAVVEAAEIPVVAVVKVSAKRPS
ncbi:hypothetical protein [Massilia sp. MS-15]|uniref:hypothetical protein n=1 Tax=Massilia sp. MS-15 TaxID=2878200 RepID=UPI001CD22340|nr:hypothetical protein [Massilia sp. MS-15]MCA1248130.1 hypothetical protein [Massilia sp. MS-15]